MIFHVSKLGNDNNIGCENEPFLTISKAASVAMPGDTVKVHKGIYREWVNPQNSGTSEHRIVYEAFGDGEAVITGAEEISGFELVEGSVYKAEVSNDIFTVRNPFKERLYGDWLFADPKPLSLGDVYVNGKSIYEKETLEDVKNPKEWELSMYPETSLECFCVEVLEDKTVFYVNLLGKNPNEEKMEISVRPYCFWPEKNYINYITVRGFTLTKASPKWAPPTALQEGLIGPNWSKGWIIENNKISESKCSGVSLGKDLATGDNEWSNLKFKFGTQREQEVIFRALHNGWSKETIGSHIVRYNEIFECEQCGIVGHLGCVFSEIYGNKIHHIHHKQYYHGAEVAGIKLHASIDVSIHDNSFYSCYRGVWFDWQAQGTHLYNNVFFENLSEDLFVEVCHGPYMVDHNIFLSKMNYRNVSQGGAFAHNLFAGRMVINPDRGRQTPYHFPHETAVAGYSTLMGGDDRFYNNIFLRDDDMDNTPKPMGFFEHLPLKEKTKEELEADEKAKMDGLPTKNNAMLYPVGLGSYEAYPDKNNKFWENPGRRDYHLPCDAFGNLYLNNAVPTSWEKDAKVVAEKGIEFSWDINKAKAEIKILDPKLIKNTCDTIITTEVLGKTYHAEMNFENADETPYIFDKDFFGNVRKEGNLCAGPFELGGEDEIIFTV